MSVIAMNEQRIDFTPIGNQVAFKPHKIDKTEGGIVLPDSAAEDASSTPSGTVLAIGPDVKQCKIGDVLVAGSGTPVTKIKRGRIEFCVVNEDVLAGIVVDNPPKEKPEKK